MTPDTLKISSKPGVAMGEGLPRDYYDPDAKLPRLPMPYRMIDNVLRDLIEDALEQARDDPPREEPPAPIAPSFSLDTPDVVSLQPTKNGLMIFVGTRSGKVLCVNSLRGDVVGEPIDLEEPINCMTLAADERLLAVAVGGVSGVGGEGEEVEPKPSTVKLMLVQQDRPFLKTMTSTKLSAAAVSISFSFDSCVFAARLCTNQLECFRTMIQVPLLVEEEVEPASPLMGKKLGAGVAEGVEGADPEAREAAPEGAKVTEPFRVLLTSERPAPPAAAGTTVVMLGSSPRVRQVGELESKHCACVHIVILDTHLVEKFRLRESALPPPAEGEEEAAPPTTAAEQQLRLPHAVTAVAMDTSTVLMLTGLANGACVVWNTVFGTQLFALKRHKAAVCAASFTHYQQPGETPLLVTAGADGVIHIHSIENGELLSSFEHKAPVPRILRILPTCIPLVLFQYDQLRGGGADRGGGVPEGSEESAVLEVFSLVDCSTKAVLTLPAPYMQGARRVRVELPMLGGGSDLGEMVGALTLELPPDLPPRAEGEEEEEVAAEGGGGEGEVEEEGAKEKGKGRWKVVAFRMIDMLAVAFPHMVKTQYGSWIQTSAKDTYWQHVGGRLAQTAGNAVTDRYLSDAAIVAGRGRSDKISSPRANTSRRDSLTSPRNLSVRVGVSPLPMSAPLDRPPPTTNMPSPAAASGARSPLLKREDSRSSLVKTAGVLPVASGGGAGAASLKSLAGGASPMAFQRRDTGGGAGGGAGGGTGTRMGGGSSRQGSSKLLLHHAKSSGEEGGGGWGRPPSNRSSTGSMLKTGATEGVLSLANLHPSDTVAARSYFDPVQVVMHELHVRAEQKERRKISRQKRTEEMFASLN